LELTLVPWGYRRFFLVDAGFGIVSVLCSETVLFFLDAVKTDRLRCRRLGDL
jgi:hypothetical protein